MLCFLFSQSQNHIHLKWRNIEQHSKCILTALWLHSKYSYETAFKHSDRIRGRIKMASHFKSCQNVPNALNEPECTSNASRLLPESISILKILSWNALRMPSESFDCHSNAVRMSRLAFEWGRTYIVILNTSESHISRNIQRISFRRHSGLFRL